MHHVPVVGKVRHDHFRVLIHIAVCDETALHFEVVLQTHVVAAITVAAVGAVQHHKVEVPALERRHGLRDKIARVMTVEHGFAVLVLDKIDVALLAAVMQTRQRGKFVAARDFGFLKGHDARKRNGLAAVAQTAVVAQRHLQPYAVVAVDHQGLGHGIVQYGKAGGTVAKVFGKEMIHVIMRDENGVHIGVIQPKLYLMEVGIGREIDHQLIIDDGAGAGADFLSAQLTRLFAVFAGAEQRRDAFCGGSAEDLQLHGKSPPVFIRQRVRKEDRRAFRQRVRLLRPERFQRERRSQGPLR